MFATASGLFSFAAAATLYWVCTMFVYVYLLGTAALLDPTGRLGTLGTGCERLAFAVGAPVGGLFVDFGSYAWVGVMAAVACALIAPLFLARLSGVLRAAGEAKRHSARNAVAPMP
jgi:predicted MFS family arabinose efflux permease